MRQDLLYTTKVREDARLRESFNALTRKTFGFDFADWYAAGQWTDAYIPHVLVLDGQVVSNVSVNRMTFRVGGETRRYLQLGTVMTDDAFRGQGLNRMLMERVIADYAAVVDGIYLFANDRVLSYYPKFGFTPAVETAYTLPVAPRGAAPYRLQRVAVNDKGLLAALEKNPIADPNDGFRMIENAGLFRFWLMAEYGDCIYHLPEIGGYVIAQADAGVLQILQSFADQPIDYLRLAAAFDGVEAAALGYTPADPSGWITKPHREEDTTLFLLGEPLQTIERERLRFPALSHA